MNSTPHNANPPDFGEETLRLMANLPAPAGLEGRVHAALRAAPERDSDRRTSVAGMSRRGRVLAWPTVLTPRSSWMRTAAAAAIVFVIAGGGWGVYTRVEHNQPAKVIAMPPHVVAPGGFAGAGAKRTPETLPGPVLLQPVAPKPAEPQAAQPKLAKKSVAKSAGAGASARHPVAVAAPRVPQ